jgi:hypothetical protein
VSSAPSFPPELSPQDDAWMASVGSAVTRPIAIASNRRW